MKQKKVRERIVASWLLFLSPGAASSRHSPFQIRIRVESKGRKLWERQEKCRKQRGCTGGEGGYKRIATELESASALNALSESPA